VPSENPHRKLISSNPHAKAAKNRVATAPTMPRVLAQFMPSQKVAN